VQPFPYGWPLFIAADGIVLMADKALHDKACSKSSEL